MGGGGGGGGNALIAQLGMNLVYKYIYTSQIYLLSKVNCTKVQKDMLSGIITYSLQKQCFLHFLDWNRH